MSPEDLPPESSTGEGTDAVGEFLPVAKQDEVSFDEEEYERIVDRFNVAISADVLTPELVVASAEALSFFMDRSNAHAGRQEIGSASYNLGIALNVIHGLLGIFEKAKTDQIVAFNEFSGQEVEGYPFDGFEAEKHYWEKIHKELEFQRRVIEGIRLAREGRMTTSREILSDIERDLVVTESIANVEVSIESIQSTLHEVDGYIAFRAKNYASARAAFERAKFGYARTLERVESLLGPGEVPAIMTLNLIAVEIKSAEMRLHQHLDLEDYETGLQAANIAAERARYAVELGAQHFAHDHFLNISIRGEERNWRAWSLHVQGHQLRIAGDWDGARARYLQAEEEWVASSNEYLALGGPIAKVVQEERQGFAFVTTSAAIRRLDHERIQNARIEALSNELAHLRDSLLAALGSGVTVNANTELVAKVEQQAAVVQRVESHVKASLERLARELETVGTSEAAHLAAESRALSISAEGGDDESRGRIRRFLQRVADFAQTTGALMTPVVQMISELKSVI
jgi:hypothetical protein